jgi:hypothetical protein
MDGVLGTHRLRRGSLRHPRWSVVNAAEHIQSFQDRTGPLPVELRTQRAMVAAEEAEREAGAKEAAEREEAADQQAMALTMARYEPGSVAAAAQVAGDLEAEAADLERRAEVLRRQAKSVMARTNEQLEVCNGPDQ